MGFLDGKTSTCFLTCISTYMSHTPTATGSYVRPAGWLANEIQAILEIFKIHFRLK